MGSPKREDPTQHINNFFFVVKTSHKGKPLTIGIAKAHVQHTFIHPPATDSLYLFGIKIHKLATLPLQLSRHERCKGFGQLVEILKKRGLSASIHDAQHHVNKEHMQQVNPMA